MSPRELCMKVHRWSGLAIALFLIVAGLTGTVIAYERELDSALLPEWFEVQPVGEALSPFELARIAERLEPRAQVTLLELDRAPTASARISLDPRIDPATGEPFPHEQLQFDEVFLDPYTGQVLGKRLIDQVGLGAANLISTVYMLHYSLLLGDWGVWVFGAVALVWALNCLFGLYLTFPARSRNFLESWKRSWMVRALRPAWRFAFEFHRAGSLWMWVLLLVFALSALHFNLDEQVYRPMIASVLPYRIVEDRLPRPQALPAQPRLDMQAARERGRELMARQASQRGFTVSGESYLYWWREHDAYVYAVKSSLDVRQQGGQTRVYFSARDGRELAFDHPKIAAGNAVTAWLGALHMAEVGGWPYRMFVALLGLVIAALSITGIVVWLKRSNVGARLGGRRT